jgi:hypothetical protein
MGDRCGIFIKNMQQTIEIQLLANNFNISIAIDSFPRVVCFDSFFSNVIPSLS